MPGRIAAVRVEPVAGPAVAPLPGALRSAIETLAGTSMGDVKVHYNSDKPVALHALAYAQGRDIYVAPGGEARLPHEAWHVAQQ